MTRASVRANEAAHTRQKSSEIAQSIFVLGHVQEIQLLHARYPRNCTEDGAATHESSKSCVKPPHAVFGVQF
jgi:hypothetical protein